MMGIVSVSGGSRSCAPLPILSSFFAVSFGGGYSGRAHIYIYIYIYIYITSKENRAFSQLFFAFCSYASKSTRIDLIVVHMVKKDCLNMFLAIFKFFGNFATPYAPKTFNVFPENHALLSGPKSNIYGLKNHVFRPKNRCFSMLIGLKFEKKIFSCIYVPNGASNSAG